MPRARVATVAKRLSLTLPADLEAGVRELAERRRVPMGSILREFVSAGLDRQRLVDRIAVAVEPVSQAV